MKSIFTLSIFVSFIFISCKKEDVPSGNALLSNSSFEENGNFSTSGWVTNNTSSSNNVPADGGEFSLRIDPDVSPTEAFASYTVEGLEGTKLIKLNCSINSFDNWPGSITLKKISSGMITTVLATVGSDENSWLIKTLEVTTTFSTGDKLLVHLSAGSTEVAGTSQYVLFDVVELTAE